MAETIYYVDPDISGGAGNGTSWENAYSSLNQAEGARNANITAGNAVVFQCGYHYNTTYTDDSTAVTFDGWTTDADSYVAVRTDGVDRHAGVWDDTKYILTKATGSALGVGNCDHFRAEWLQIAVTSITSNYHSPITVTTLGVGSDIRVSHCILKQSGGTSREPGIYVNSANLTVTVWNTIIYGHGSNGNVLSSSIAIPAATAVRVYGCTLIGGTHGLRNSAAGCTVTAKNTYGYGVTAGFSNAGTLTTSYCASNTTELSGTGDVDSVAYSTANFLNVTPGNADYLKVKSGGALDGAGTSLTDDPPGSTALGVDISGASRTVTWDIGAFEFIAAAKALLPRFLPYRLWTRRYN